MAIKGTGQISLTDMNDTVAQITAPTNPVQGMTWFNITNKQLYVYLSGAWVLSTEGLQVGGRNLVLDSNTDVVASSYLVATYTISENFINGTTYTATIKGTKLASQSFGLWQNGGTAGKGNFVNVRNDIWTLTFVSSSPTAGNEKLFSIYQPASATAGAVTIDWIKVEVGNKGTDWSPAPEDLEKGVSDLGDKVGLIDDRTSVTALIDTVVFSEDFTSILSNKANSEDLSGLATGEELVETQSTVTQYVDGRIDGDGGVNEAINAVSSELSKTANEINAKFSSSGGINLVKNSIGYVGKDFWTINGVVNTIQNQELQQLGFGSGFETKVGAGGYIEQTIPTAIGADYSLSFWLKKTVDNATTGDAGVEIYANGVKLAFIGKAKGTGLTSGLNKYELGTYSFTTNYSEIKVRITCGAGAEAIITGLMLNVGTVPLQWQHANGEIYNTSVQMNLNGIKVISSAYNGHTIMSPQEFSGYAEVLDENNQPVMTKVFTLNKDTTEVTKIQVDKEINMSPVKAIPIVSATSNGWAFIATD